MLQAQKLTRKVLEAFEDVSISYLDQQENAKADM